MLIIRCIEINPGSNWSFDLPGLAEIPPCATLGEIARAFIARFKDDIGYELYRWRAPTPILTGPSIAAIAQSQP